MELTVFNTNQELIAFSKKLDRITSIVGNIVGWMLIPMILSLAYEVVARYAFGAPLCWVRVIPLNTRATFVPICFMTTGHQKNKP